MNFAGQVGEEDLQAWADGRLAPERAEAVQSYLLAHPDEYTRLLQYREQSQGLRAAFAGEVPPIPARLQVARLIDSRNRKRRRLIQIAAAILILTLGGIAGWVARELI